MATNSSIMIGSMHIPLRMEKAEESKVALAEQMFSMSQGIAQNIQAHIRVENVQKVHHKSVIEDLIDAYERQYEEHVERVDKKLKRKRSWIAKRLDMKKNCKRTVKAYDGPDSDTIVESINVPEIKQQSEGDISERRKIIGPQPQPSTQRRTRSKTRKIRMDEAQISNLVRAIGKIVKKRGGLISIIDKSGANDVEIANGRVQAKVRHLRGKKSRVDMVNLKHGGDKILEDLFEAIVPLTVVRDETVKAGCSGYVYRYDKLQAVKSRPKGKFFIIRGRHEGKLYDARQRVTNSVRNSMHHYSSNANKFWENFEKEFISIRSKPDDGHECSQDYSVEDCGRVAGILAQVIAPCWKITCTKCAHTDIMSTSSNLDEAMRSRALKAKELIEGNLAQFDHVISFLNRYISTLGRRNSSVDEAIEVQKLIGDVKTEPCASLNFINETLQRSEKLNGEDFSKCTKSLLQVVRWVKNRTDSIKQNDLSRFRNKISGKALVNPSLMCDNQRDKNGNFVWGVRGYHAKRFFNNFFERVDSTNGYKKHVIRTFPNGQRELAIGNLIVSTNFSLLRQQMVGKAIEKIPLTKECVSRREGSFVYSNCCVTDDSGNPILSEIKMPTKNHLVIGNSGDPKYVDLPSDESGMFIAKEGYCYMNIFLAMLINVSEGDAKDFTKMVRDVIAERLGKWPSMLDVATACFLLTVFYPDTKNAELPRILVDHKTKTMHVIDSYGSMHTGYHVLKANTINQLINFASDNIDSDMKHYKVGGMPTRDAHTVKKLIRCVMHADALKYMLVEEPHIAFFGLVSPSILVALHSSPSLESVISHWLSRNEGVGISLLKLRSLTEKVSRARFLKDQHALILASADAMLRSLQDSDYTSYEKERAHAYISTLVERFESDQQLIKDGFVLRSDDELMAIEKNYRKELMDSYNALNLSERLRVGWRSVRYSGLFERFTIAGTVNDLRETAELSCTSGLRRVRTAGGAVVAQCRKLSANACSRAMKTFANVICSTISYMIPDIVKFMNVLVAINLLLAVFNKLRQIADEHRTMKARQAATDEYIQVCEIGEIYDRHRAVTGQYPTFEEVREEISKCNHKLLATFDRVYDQQSKYESKSAESQQYEKSLAFVALLLMVFDSERSDCVYKVLCKLRALTNICGERVQYQSLDDFENVVDDKKLTIDFELSSEMQSQSTSGDTMFTKWWDTQVQTGRTVPHYRCEGEFSEFTRESCIEVANKIAHSAQKEWIIRGSVGSGKSTGFPKALSNRGRVLVLEPTRPLAENVCRQLRGDPFFASPTLRMRGLSSFGSDPITIMTSGYAFAFFANNPLKLKDFDFIQIDECHVVDANCMAFYSLLREYEFNGKILRTSATPQGRECDFHTQYPVGIQKEEHLSFESFVTGLGTGVAYDALAHGCNILIYVASYNEVDSLGKLLTDKKYQVTKIDGRTMKTGQISIETKGTSAQPHFLVATNIIENGVTLNVDVVVDFGTKVVADYDIDNRSMHYTKKPISYGERLQRMGRVGRKKAGFVLRIGSTQKGIQDVPVSTATQAAFNCFAYGLPVMTANVTTSLMANCTVRQAQTMNCFELPSVLTYSLVASDGCMHPDIHAILKPYKLSESEIMLREGAFNFESTCSWMTVRQYNRIGMRLNLPDDTKIPFLARDVPEGVYEKIWQVALQVKARSGCVRMSAYSVAKVAYTLKTDVNSIDTTLQCVESLLQDEYAKEAQMQSLSTSSMRGNSLSMLSVINMIKHRYAKNHTKENIEKLTAVRDQLREFRNVSASGITDEIIAAYPKLESVMYQGKDAIANFSGVQGRWNGSLLTKDLLVVGGVIAGGCWLLYSSFINRMSEQVEYQGKNKTKRLRFRDARDRKMGREAYGDDGTIEHYFGSAYTKKGKEKGYTRGMGSKARKFNTFYGFDIDEVSLIRYLDPLTGATLDEQPYTDIAIVQEHFGNVRQRMVLDDELDPQKIITSPGIQGFAIRDGAKKVIKLDLTPHNPLKVCDRFSTIAGFPERDSELRQTGKAVEIERSEVPNPSKGQVEYEGKTAMKGLRDYNGIASCVCVVNNFSEGGGSEMHAIGYGSYLITNGHFFRRTNGHMTITSHHGEFKVHNIRQLKIFGIPKKDMALIRLPKDFPPFPMKLRFREPVAGESIVLVGNNFQEKYISSMVSESCHTYPRDNGGFWKHYISTKQGSCGQPLVSVEDGFIVGIHALHSNESSVNYYTNIIDGFEKNILSKLVELKWEMNWAYNPNNVCWGSLNIPEQAPAALFRPEKIARSLQGELVTEQGKRDRDAWLYNSLEHNLKAVGQLDTTFVTKHVVKGKCPLFALYLDAHPEAKQFFKPLMGFYGKSALNREAYIKDIMKYSSVIDVGRVDTDVFEKAASNVFHYINNSGFMETKFVTDTDAIFGSLNMKAAVGALYKGKKSEYFEGLTLHDRDALLQESCKRLYFGQMGVWNGNLKAELRPVEKIRENKTRTFTAAPIETLLGAKVCVDDFNNQFYDHHTECPWTVGISKFYGGWDKLMRKLPEGWVYCDADGSRFDSSLTPYLINSVLQLRLTFSEEWDVGREMLKNLYTEIMYTPIATPDGTIVKKFRGNNSGQPSTVVDNTLMVFVSLLYSLEKSGIDTENFEEFIVFFINGDDLIIAVRPDMEKRILDPMSENFANLGLNYDFSNRVRNKSELWFMSHQAVLREGMYIPKLEPERIVSILEWTRSKEPEHRLEAICAAMIEAWGHDDLLSEVRKFYAWILEQEPYSHLAREGKAPFISEIALRQLYLDKGTKGSELLEYLDALCELEECETSEDESENVCYQADDTIDAAEKKPKQQRTEEKKPEDESVVIPREPDRDVNAGSSGTIKIPRVQQLTSKLDLPKFHGKPALNLQHLLTYKPSQVNISNTRASLSQFNAWFGAVRDAYDVKDEDMTVLMNGLMVWCIENGTSPNINGNWYMMDGEEQLEYPLKPVVENAKPTLRQIMAHMSNIAEAYIEMRNSERPYMPRYGLQRNLTDMSLARYAFDFYEITSKTPVRAKEAHIQMKAAALRNASTRLFGLDGNVGNAAENTERHTADDVDVNTHSFTGARMH